MPVPTLFHVVDVEVFELCVKEFLREGQRICKCLCTISKLLILMGISLGKHEVLLCGGTTIKVNVRVGCPGQICLVNSLCEQDSLFLWHFAEAA